MKVTVEIDDDDVRRVLGPFLVRDASNSDGHSTSKLLSVAEVAYHLGVSRPKVYQLLARGEIDSVNIGNTKRISPVALAEFIARPKLMPASSQPPTGRS